MITITNAAELQAMKDTLDGDFELGNDIAGIGDFEPVGGWNGQDPFTGTFNGKGYTISNLTVDKVADDYIGLFGELFGATIQNVTLKDFVLTGDRLVGTLAGDCTNTDVINVVVINTTIIGDEYTGGLLGNVYAESSGVISDCSSTGSVTGATAHWIGGLVGAYDDYTMVDCYSEVIVIGYNSVGGLIGSFTGGSVLRSYATGTVDGDYYVGGFMGTLYTPGTVDRCFATGNVTCVANYAGGFVGEQYGPGIISDCYAKGDVDGDDYVGGFAGTSEDVNRCYSTGAITHGGGATMVGGFTGYNGETITLSFWDKTTSGEATGAGGGSPQTGLTGKTTAEMKNINTILTAGWSIPQIWNALSGCNGGYPCLVGVNSCCSASAAPLADPTIAPKKVSLELIRNIEMMNTGRSYVSKTGDFVYESRFKR